MTIYKCLNNKPKKSLQATLEGSLLEFEETMLTHEMKSLSGNYIVLPPLEPQSQVKKMLVTKFNGLKKKQFFPQFIIYKQYFP